MSNDLIEQIMALVEDERMDSEYTSDERNACREEIRALLRRLAGEGGLPPFPDHPSGKGARWSIMEEQVIREYANACRLAGGVTVDEIEIMARWIGRHSHGEKDHACGECVPGGDLVSDDFKCAVHIAKRIGASSAAVAALGAK